MAKPHLAIVGATGAVGQEFLKVLDERGFEFGELTLLSSKRSAGKKINYKNSEYVVQELTADSFKGVDIALFSAGGSISKEFGPIAVQAGAVVVDNSSAFRMDPATPLVIPEINPEDAKNHKGIIANPNCSTIIMLMAVYPIHKINPVKRIVVSTYQAASGAGAEAMEELRTQAGDYLAGRPLQNRAFIHPIAFNAFSHDSKVDPDTLYNQEEIKMVKETHKILHDDSLIVSPTCIRIGSFRAHAESIHLELTNPVDMAAIKKCYDGFPGVRLQDDPENNHFPMPLETSGGEDVLVGRIRPAYCNPNGNELELFCCGDQLLKGAAQNAVQIAELL